MAAHAYLLGAGDTEIWYYPNAPAGLTSATFTHAASTGRNEGVVTEWSGAAALAPLDQSGTASCASSVVSCAVSAAGPVVVAGELGISNIGTSGTGTLTSGTAGWTQQFLNRTSGYVGDSNATLGSGTPAETENTTSATTWAMAMATFRPATTGSGAASASLTGAGYSVLGQGTTGFPPTTLDGTDQTLNRTATAYVEFSDASGSGLGWNVPGQVSTLFTNTIHSVNDGVLNTQPP